MSSTALFHSHALTLRDAVLFNGGGHRSVSEDEPFFPSMEKAKEFGAANDKGGGYIVGIIVILVLPNGQKIGLTTTAQFERAHQQARAYLKAHDESPDSKGVMYTAWEVGFLSTSVN